MFCPFINNNCVQDCVFNNHKFQSDSVENCTLSHAAKNMQQIEFTDRTPKDYLDSIESKLIHIETNTAKDQTDSWQINDKLDSVIDKLNDIKRVLTQ